MVVRDFYDLDRGHAVSIKPTIRQSVDDSAWSEYQSCRSCEVHSKLACPISVEGMAFPRRTLQIAEGRRGGENREAPPKQRPVLGSKAALSEAIIGADSGQLTTPPDDLDGGGSLTC